MTVFANCLFAMVVAVAAGSVFYALQWSACALIRRRRR